MDEYGDLILDGYINYATVHIHIYIYIYILKRTTSHNNSPSKPLMKSDVLVQQCPYSSRSTLYNIHLYKCIKGFVTLYVIMLYAVVL